ncbi:MAG: hypothetical protein KF872_11115 [Chitinophagales bacterium]|nr:hypothetical protein [Chitinophagales bacterium]
MKSIIITALLSLMVVGVFSQTETPKFLRLKALEINTPIREVVNALPLISSEDSAAQVFMVNTILTDVLIGNLQAFEKGNDETPLSIDEVKTRVGRIDSTYTKGKYFTTFPLVNSVRFTEKWTYSGSQKQMTKAVARIDFFKEFISKEGVHMGNSNLFYVKLKEQ